MIKPDSPSVLADGDTITFGKAVGRDESIVSPIIAKVRLLFGTLPPSPEPASSITPATPAAPTAAVHTSSGRYGIYTPAMTSSSSDSSESEDIEEIPPPSQAPRLCGPLPFGFGPRTSHAYQMHHVFHTRHAHHTQMIPNPPGRLGLLRRILPRVGSIEEIATGHGSSRLSPISVYSASRSPSVVEVRREDVQPPAAEPEDISPSPFPEHRSRAQSPSEDMDLESDAPSEYPGKSGGMEIILEASFDGPLPVLAASSRLCTPEPDPEPVHSFQQRQVEDDESDGDMYATPAPQLIPEPVQEPEPVSLAVPPLAPEVPELFMDDAAWCLSDYPSRSASPAPAAEPFDMRVENLKNRLADLEQRMLASSKASTAEPSAGDAEPEQVEQPEQSEQPAAEVAAPAPAEAVAPMVDNLKEMLQSLDELRKKAEADMAQELDAVRALRAEAEAAAHAALALAVAPAVPVTVDLGGDHGTDKVSAPHAARCARDAHGAQTPPAASGLKRKRDELEDGSGGVYGAVAPVAQTPVSCHVLFDRLAAEPPRKRARGVDVARRIALGVAKTTAIAAVGAVATWSALAFS
ncbi:uncharacterized protein PHACADRAFT_263539 [Phanerochaete carnosa HHB-10118-sp]|uniref:Uncharacterized protein n=1 Tax=Phanerochaete carnosa (strain HHB-10118-sp) TaxID=650164 RepID=K5WMA6_PHACS|nr:uncharacterized protein PHACADRAFT_263539 [Phanerochaete carnosa HHB-10118-sp]EKM51422.1 hypothetical protein PHACADRAFT_263539 [Phanerochaete carnosa HHB-10118-sp]